MTRGRISRALALGALVFVAACALTSSAPLPAVPPAAVLPVPSAEETEPSSLMFGPELGGSSDPPDFSEPPELPALEVAWAKELPPLKVECANTGAKAALRLYGADGSVDPDALETFSEVAADANGVHPLHPRLVQLAVKTARHFGAKSLVVVSAYRKPRRKDSEDHHARGEALDFKLPGVDYRQLAAYLRSLPRVGVGVYTDARTRYVHLDVREKSFHWLDASPPGVVWREAQIPDAKQAARDAQYSDESDLPLDAK
jgi:uncharacterized protein YcbK (DUF882 family)